MTIQLGICLFFAFIAAIGFGVISHGFWLRDNKTGAMAKVEGLGYQMGGLIVVVVALVGAEIAWFAR